MKCPIKNNPRGCDPAVITPNKTYSYNELNQLIEADTNTNQIFFAKNTIENIVHIFSMLRKGFSIFPVNPRIPQLPDFQLGSNGEIYIYTSGSTGDLKIVKLLPHHFILNATNSHPDLILNTEDSWLLSLSLSHVGGLAILFRAFSRGASVSLDPTTVKITHLSLVPIQLQKLLDSKLHYKNLKALLLGGSPLNYSQCLQAYKRNIPLYITYGMTEMASQIATSKFHPNNKLLTATILPKRKVKISSEGFIMVKGCSLFCGYHPNNTPLLDNGYFVTEDSGKIYNDQLHVQGRINNSIISGGENIDLAYLKKTILALDNINSCTISSRNSKKWGQRPVAYIQSEEKLDKKKIQNQLKKILPNFYVPFDSDIYIQAIP